MGGTPISSPALSTLHFLSSPGPSHRLTRDPDTSRAGCLPAPTVATGWSLSLPSSLPSDLTLGAHGLASALRVSPQDGCCHGPSYRAISHLLTSRPLLGILPMPLWGSLLVNVFRKWI